jgi:hypothetical protein
VHRTYRWLDEPPKLLGFTFTQWLALLAASAAGYGLVELAHVPLKVAVSAGVFVIGLPATLTYLSEGGRLDLGRLLRDVGAWVLTPHRYLACAETYECRAASVLVLAPEEHNEGARWVDAQPDDPLEDLLEDSRWGR